MKENIFTYGACIIKASQKQLAFMTRSAKTVATKKTKGDVIAASGPELVFSRSVIGTRLLEIQREGSPSQRVIADFLLRNPVRIPAWGIEDLSSRVGVSTATLSRFVRMLGFVNYAALRTSVADILQTMLQPVEKLRSSFESQPGRLSTPVTEGLETTLANARVAAEGLSVAQLKVIVEAITRAEQVYTMGFGLSAHLAAILSLDLAPFCHQLTNVVDFGGTEVAAGRLMNVSSKDVLIVVSLPRYAADAISLTAYARRRGAVVIAITDSPASPLARHAHHLLLAPATHPVLSSSQSATVVVIEALVTSLMVSNHKNVEQAAKLTDAISAYLYGGELGGRGSLPVKGRRR
jgi:DNA-binding MurR/RpiR family transcriptional regulator